MPVLELELELPPVSVTDKDMPVMLEKTGWILLVTFMLEQDVVPETLSAASLNLSQHPFAVNGFTAVTVKVLPLLVMEEHSEPKGFESGAVTVTGQVPLLKVIWAEWAVAGP